MSYLRNRNSSSMFLEAPKLDEMLEREQPFNIPIKKPTCYLNAFSNSRQSYPDS